MKRDKLKERLAEGLTLEEIGKEFGMTRQGVHYWCNKYELNVNSWRAPFTEEELRDAVETSTSFVEVNRKLYGEDYPGSNSSGWKIIKKYIERLDLDTYHFVHGHCKLTRNEARKIRNLYASDQYTLKALADKFGVNSMTIHRIVNGKTYI